MEKYLRIIAVEKSKYSKKVYIELSLTTQYRLIKYNPLGIDYMRVLNICYKRDARAYIEQYVNDHFEKNKNAYGYKTIRLKEVTSERHNHIYICLTYVIDEDV